jgi:hypothetical protein
MDQMRKISIVKHIEKHKMRWAEKFERMARKFLFMIQQQQKSWKIRNKMVGPNSYSRNEHKYSYPWYSRKKTVAEMEQSGRT